jgi:hypothetical protein
MAKKKERKLQEKTVGNIFKKSHEFSGLLNEIFSKNAPDLESGEFPYKVISKETKSLILSHETAEPLNELCSKILRIANWDKNFSQKFIEAKIETLLVETHDIPPNEREKSVLEILEELETYHVEHEIILPVFGLRLDSDIFELGNVTFRKITDQIKSEIIERANSAIDSTRNTDNEKALIKNQMNPLFISSLETGTVAIVKVPAEPIRAKERAQEECGRSLDLLRFATPYVQQNAKEIGFGLAGDVLAGKGISLCFAEDGSLQTSKSNVGSWMPFEFNKEIHQQLEKMGIMTLSKLLKKDLITKFEKMILSAVFWCAKAQLQTLPEFRLLCLITSLESVLNPRNDRPIRMGVAEGAALLFGKGLEQRRKLRDFIGKLYDLRSSVSHGGHPEVLGADLQLLTSIAGTVIFELLKKIKKFKNRKELLCWLDDKRLA